MYIKANLKAEVLNVYSSSDWEEQVGEYFLFFYYQENLKTLKILPNLRVMMDTYYLHK